jgi:hypothetical protein
MLGSLGLAACTRGEPSQGVLEAAVSERLHEQLAPLAMLSGGGIGESGPIRIPEHSCQMLGDGSFRCNVLIEVAAQESATYLLTLRDGRWEAHEEEP